MKRILIIGASILQIPAIIEAKKMGMYVGVLDYNAKALGIKYADKFYHISTIDIDGVVKAAEDFRPDGVLTLATDMPMRSVAAVCEKMNLPGISFETAIKATDKEKMIQAFDKCNVAHPWYYVLSEEKDVYAIKNKISYPCISKPVDNSGSRGVCFISNEQELFEGIKYSKNNARNGKVILEEYLSGNEVSVEVMVINQEIHILQITDKLTTGAPHFVEMGHSQPSILLQSEQEKIKELAVKAIEAVGIENGPAHVEIMNTKNGPKMIELGARMGGDCITTHLVPLSTGINMIRAAILIACGEKVDICAKYSKGAAIRYLTGQEGVIENISGIEEAKGIKGIQEVTVLKGNGDKIVDIESSIDRLGFLIAQDEDVKKAREICQYAAEKIKVNVK